MVMRIGYCENGHQIMARINYGTDFHPFLKSITGKRIAYNKKRKSELFSACNKYQKYVNDDNPPCPNDETLRVTNIFFKDSIKYFEMPLWDALTANINNISDIHKIGINMDSFTVFSELFQKSDQPNSNDEISLQDQVNKFTFNFYGLYNELTAFVLLLLKAELDHDVIARDILLVELHKHLTIYFALNEISDELIYLFLIIKKRFTNKWNRGAQSNIVVLKIPEEVKRTFRENKRVLRFLIDSYPENQIRPHTERSKYFVINSYMQKNYENLSHHAKLFYKDKFVLKSIMHGSG